VVAAEDHRHAAAGDDFRDAIGNRLPRFLDACRIDGEVADVEEVDRRLETRRLQRVDVDRGATGIGFDMMMP
jgi:hypothetical protein